MRAALAAAALVLAAMSAARADDDFAGGTIIFARGGSLWRVDAKGKAESELVKLPATATVRELRTDAAGTLLMVDLGGTWMWMPLDGSANPTLRSLPCAQDQPAQLADDASCVVCASISDPKQATLYNFSRDRVWPLANVPPATARLAVTPGGRALVWADADGVWSAPPTSLAAKTKVAPEAPLRGFLASPDGARAIGVYTGEIYTDAHHTKQGELLQGFALDGTGARRNATNGGVPIEWSHDAQYVLVQDGSDACEIRATGGEYKCWAGFTMESASPDARWMVLLGPQKKGAKTTAGTPGDDVAVPPPSGALALYRGKLEGLYKEAPTLIVSNVDGAAVWVPKQP